MKTVATNFLSTLQTTLVDRQEQRVRKEKYPFNNERGSYVRVEADPEYLFEDRKLYNEDQNIFFVPGRNGHPSDFFPLINRLREHGIASTFYVICLGENAETSVAEDSEVLAHIIKEVQSGYVEVLTGQSDRSVSASKKAIVIGLSKGGLVAARAAQYLTGKIGKVITMGSPLYGTTAAVWPIVGQTTLEDMSWLNPRVVKLAEDLKENERAPVFFHVYSDVDYVVSPPETAYYAFTPPRRIYQCEEKVTHFGLTSDRGVGEAIAGWLKYGESGRRKREEEVVLSRGRRDRGDRGGRGARGDEIFSRPPK